MVVVIFYCGDIGHIDSDTDCGICGGSRNLLWRLTI